jgi:hypothetical protein
MSWVSGLRFFMSSDGEGRENGNPASLVYSPPSSAYLCVQLGKFLSKLTKMLTPFGVAVCDAWLKPPFD